MDERGALRKHRMIFVDGDKVMGRENLSDEVKQDSEIYIFQALGEANMHNHLMVGTRKGTFIYRRSSSGWELNNKGFLGAR